MSRMNRFDWLSRQACRRSHTFSHHDRRLRVEALEDRRLLSITVDTLVDENDGIGIGTGTSLRDAIAAATPGETIDFSVTGTINLTLGQLTIGQDLTVAGPGAEDLIIDAGDNSRVLQVTGGTVNVSGLTFTNGYLVGADGGGILNSGNLTISSSVVSSNVVANAGAQGGGIYNSGTLEVINSEITNNFSTLQGGGIYNIGTATITGSSIIGNHTPSNGGGILNGSSGSIEIVRSTISGNGSLNARGGGLQTAGTGSATISESTFTGNYAAVGGGAIMARGSGTLDVTLSTFSGNTSYGYGGGIAADGSTTTISHSTITGNSATNSGGGFYTITSVNTPNITLSHSIVSGNTAPVASEINRVSGTFTLDEYNLLGSNSATNAQAFAGVAAGVTDITATSDGTDPTALASILDTTLANNGGSTLTHALLPGSPAIDAGNAAIASPPANDQRGAPFARIAGGTIDIGAYELQSLTLVVDTLDDVVDGDYTANNFSLREAIELTNANPGADTITFDAALNGGSILMDDASGEMLITDAVTIDATSLTSGITIDAGDGTDDIFNTNDGYRIFLIDDGTAALIDVEISGLTLTGGDTLAPVNGGAILNRENLVLASSTISGNAGARGGGIYSYSGTTIINRSTLSGNDSFTGGGGIYQYGGALTVTESTISGNSAKLGGGIGVYQSDVSITRSTLSGNSAVLRGGGFNQYQGMATFSHSLITGNTAPTSSEIEVAFTGGGSATFDAFNLLGNSSKTTAQSLVGVTVGATDILATSDGTNPTALTAILNTTLANNGGPTLTHALVAGSPAINAGDVGAMAGMGGVPEYDQRGFPFGRVREGRIDIGAVESGPLSLVVDTLVDESDGDYSTNDLSLREAVELANANSGADSITFDGSLAGNTITLALGQLEISDSVTVTGLGADQLTIDAGGASRVLRITGTTTADISGLTLTGGNVGRGGGIRNEASATTTLTDMVVTGNTATTTANDAGGGIYNLGNLTIVGSTVTGDMAPNGSARGGGIWSDNTVTISDSTLSGNFAADGGGGIWNQNGTLTIANTTLTGNSADGGGALFSTGGTTSISHSTITANTAIVASGGGIYVGGGALTLSHSLVSGNTAAAGNEINRTGTAVVTLNDYNLFGDSSQTTTQAIYSTFAGATDILATSDGTNPTALTSILNTTLADNGGPTLTHALVAGSPAINAGDPAFTTPPDYDQRGAGFPRVVNVVDIGAIESLSNLIVDTLAEESDGDYSVGDLSLREAVELANTNPGADTITFAVTGQIDIASQLPTITDAVTITGPGAALLTIDAGDGTDNTFNTGDGYRIFNIDDGTGALIDVEISGLTLTGGDVAGDGGAIFNRENLTINNSTVSGNSATNAGGGLSNNTSGTVTVTGNTISGNTAGYQGAGINNAGTAIITSSTISGNYGSAYGGGIWSSNSLTITNSTIADNSANFGSGMQVAVGIADVTSSTISGNMASSGGGIYIDGGALTVTNSTISGNSATSLGGGIRVDGGTVSVSKSTITGNTAGLSGGGIHTYRGDTTLSHNLISGNSSASGSEIFFDKVTGTISVDDYNLIGDSSKTTAQALFAVAAGATDITATSDGTNPTALASILDTTLADNGGPTLTHALVPGSPAIDAGDPAAVAGVGDVPLYDQRGIGFGRVKNGRIEIGAFESEPPSADFDSDGFITGFDFLLWQIGFGTTAPSATKSDGDADNDSDVDGNDLSIWESQLGTAAPLVVSFAASESSSSAELATVFEAAPEALAETTVVVTPIRTDDLDLRRLFTNSFWHATGREVRESLNALSDQIAETKHDAHELAQSVGVVWSDFGDRVHEFSEGLDNLVHRHRGLEAQCAEEVDEAFASIADCEEWGTI
ncbi:MAG: hypothetical protein KDA57_15670 [Planctomycetales bacterium]|nr:hypothetical protein [Planctomycetales bacterium]